MTSLAQRAGHWTLAMGRTPVARFTVPNLMVRRVSGTVPITSVEVVVDDDGTTSVQLALDLSRIDTGNPRRDKDLRKPGLLDLDAHPTMRFVAERVEPDDGEDWMVYGQLTVKGVTADLPARARVGLDGPDEATVHATATLDRRSVGVKAPSFMIGTRVDIEVEAPLVRS